MDIRYSLTLVVCVIAALLVGLVAAHSQRQTAAAPVPTLQPTPLPTPGDDAVQILPNPSKGGLPALFAPSSLFVSVGTTVVWVNSDSAPHSVTADDGSFNSNVLNHGEVYEHTFTHAGIFSYSDYLNPGMHGTIEVVK